MGKLKSLKLMRVAFSIFFCLFAYALSAQTINVKGKVKDSGGESIIGANVHVLGTTSGTTTDVKAISLSSAMPTLNWKSLISVWRSRSLQ